MTPALLILAAINGPGLSCGPAPVIAQQLETQYGERLDAWWLTSTGMVVEMWLNPKSGSWTQVWRMPGGTTRCVPQGLSGMAGEAA
jgi:hypothetical protein